MTGCGSPVALQFNLSVSPGDAITLEGGLTVNRGGETTTNSVFFSTLPKRFAAEQKYSLNHLDEHVKFAKRCCCISPSLGVTGQMTFSK